MKIYKPTLSARLFVLLYQFPFFNSLKLALSPLFIWYWRRASARHEIFGIPVFAWNANRDVTSGLEMVEHALRLLHEHAPYSIEEIRKQINGIIIVPGGPSQLMCRATKCCVINSVEYTPRNPENIKSMSRIALVLAGFLASVPQFMRISKGRFGYVGIKHTEYFCLKAEVRAVRRCFSMSRQLEALSVIATFYKVLDRRSLRPGRRYHPNFTKSEIEKLSFGKKLKLNPKNDILVVEENA